MSILHDIITIITVIWEDSVIIDEMVIIIAIRVLVQIQIWRWRDCSVKSVNIPAQIDNSEIMIQTDDITNELPLLLSKDATKKKNTKTDFKNDRISILGQEMDISFGNSRHFSIPISKCYEALDRFSEENYDSNLSSVDNVALKTPY